VSSKEAVIFEQIARVTAYLHVHIELSITSVEQQLTKYQQFLVTKLGTEESISSFMLGQGEYEPKPPPMPGPNDPKPRGGNHSPRAAWTVRTNTMLWKRIADLHLHDVDDIEHHISSLWNALRRLSGHGQDQVHVKSPFIPPLANAEQHLIHPYPDTCDHLLFSAGDDLAEVRHLTSRGVNPYDPHGDLEEPPIPAKVRPSTSASGPTITKNGSTDRPKLHGRNKRRSDPKPVLASRPLTEEAFDNMVPV
jgi:hypothetical protein